MDSNKEMIIKQFTRWNILNFIEKKYIHNVFIKVHSFCNHSFNTYCVCVCVYIYIYNTCIHTNLYEYDYINAYFYYMMTGDNG